MIAPVPHFFLICPTVNSRAWPLAFSSLPASFDGPSLRAPFALPDSAAAAFPAGGVAGGKAARTSGRGPSPAGRPGPAAAEPGRPDGGIPPRGAGLRGSLLDAGRGLPWAFMSDVSLHS